MDILSNTLIGFKIRLKRWCGIDARRSGGRVKSADRTRGGDRLESHPCTRISPNAYRGSLVPESRPLFNLYLFMSAFGNSEDLNKINVSYIVFLS